MNDTQRKRLINALKIERIKLDKMTEQSSDATMQLSSPELIHQSGLVGSLINDLDAPSISSDTDDEKSQ